MRNCRGGGFVKFFKNQYVIVYHLMGTHGKTPSIHLHILIEKDKQPRVNKYKGKGIFTALACLFSPFQHRTAQVFSD